MADLIVPNFERKLSWAEQHIHNLEEPIREFRDRHPYRMRKLVQGKDKGRWILEFTETSDPSWALIIGDVLYNLRASLDYLAGALNPPGRRSSVFFPIVTSPVWSIPPVEGENDQLTRSRKSWNTATRKMADEAVTIIKELQPIPGDYEPLFHPLDLLNRLSNTDRHKELHVHVSGLTNPHTVFVMNNGTTWTSDAEIPTPGGQLGTAALQDKATITPPPELHFDAIVDVQIKGTTTQAVRGGDQGRQVVIPDALWQLVRWIRDKAVTPLSPYLYGLKPTDG